MTLWRFLFLGIGLALLPEVEKVDARDLAHVQVGEDDVDVLIDVREGLVGAFGAKDREALGLEARHQGLAFEFIVFDD